MEITDGMEVERAQPKARGIAGKGCGTLFFGAFFAVGCLFVVVILGEAVRHTEPWRWTAITCSILDSAVVETGDDQRPYRAAVRYRYRVDDRELEGDRVVRSDQGTASWDRARDLSERYPVGATATCYFDPDQPHLSVLERRLPWLGLAVLFPMIFVAVGAAGLYALWRPRPAAQTQGTRSISQSEPKLSGHKVALVLGSVFVLVGGSLFVFLFAIPAARSVAAMSWSATDCTVVGSRLRSWSTDDGTSYRADVLFEYRAGGRSWRSNRVDYFPLGSSGADGARRVLARYPEGAEATCWVDPEDPSRAVLERRLRPVHLLGLLPLLFLAAGAALIAHSRRAMRSAVASAAAAEPAAAAADAPMELVPRVSPLGKVLGAIVFAAIWNGIVAVFVWQAWQSWQRGGPDWFLTVFLIPFVLVGLAAIVFVGHFVLALFNPRPRLTMQPGQPCLGDELRIDWRFAGRASRIRRLHLVLEGREEATYRRGTDTVTDREVFATLEIADSGHDWEIARGGAAVTIPEDAMHSFDADNNRIVWELKVRGDIARWPDVDESFPVTIRPLRLDRMQP